MLQCWDQIQRRARPAEIAAGSMLTREYLTAVEDFYTRWLTPATSMSLDPRKMPTGGPYHATAGRITHANACLVPDPMIQGACADRMSIIDMAGLASSTRYIFFKHTLVGLISFALTNREHILPSWAGRRKRGQRGSVTHQN